MPNIPGGAEYIPRRSNFGGVADSVSGVVADARRLRFALMSRTLAGDMESGIDIRDELFEILGNVNNKVNEIEVRVTEGLGRLCPDVDIGAVAIEVDEKNRAILLGINLNSSNPDEESIDLIFRVNDVLKKGSQRKTIEEIVFPL